MSTEDLAQKTHQPTPRKIEKSKEEGQIPQSKEVYHFFFFSFLLLFGMFHGDAYFADFYNTLFVFLETMLAMEEGASSYIFFELFGLNIIKKTSILLGVFFGAAIVAGLLQTQCYMSIKNLRFKWEHISMIGGIQRIFGRFAIMEMVKNIGKIILLGVITFGVLAPKLYQLDTMNGMSLSSSLRQIFSTLKELLFWVWVSLCFIAALDYGWQKWKHIRKMFMSTQEIRDELKDTEGDPAFKQKRKDKRSAALKEMQSIAQTTQASLLIVNPTHFAVALQWKMRKQTAPIVLAKGTDKLAQRMKQLATARGIPVITQPALARQLYRQTQITQPILPAHYGAVAAIVRFVMQQKPDLFE